MKTNIISTTFEKIQSLNLDIEFSHLTDYILIFYKNQHIATFFKNEIRENNAIFHKNTLRFMETMRNKTNNCIYTKLNVFAPVQMSGK